MTEMVHCRGCGKELHRTASSCPQCGATQRTRRYKSKIAAGLLALFLGGLGIHRFYLGQWWGIFYLLFCWTYVPGLIALIEGFVFLFKRDERWDEIHNDGIPGGGTSGAAVVVAAVVGVIGLVFLFGLLAAIAIPAYRDYTVRAQVAEAMVTTASLRQSVTDALAQGGSLSMQDVDALASQAVAMSRYLGDVQVDPGGVIVLIMGTASGVAGKTLIYEPVEVAGEVTWSCSGGSLETNFRPSSCR